MKRGIFIYITGCDGTGKSTQARLLLEQFKKRGIKTRNLWLRFPFFLSTPLLVYARWFGFSRYENIAGICHGYWTFGKSRILRNIFPWTFLIDAALAAVIKVYLPIWLGRSIVCERFVLDNLADLEVGLDDYEFHTKLVGRLYFKLIPPRSKIIMLDLDGEVIQERRLDLRSDAQLDLRLRAYRGIARDYSLTNISSIAEAGEINRQIVRFLKD